MVEIIIDFIKERVSYFGKAPLCNLNPSHGICIMDFYLPLCARCTGIILGVLIGTITFFTILIKKKYFIRYHLLSFIFLVPCMVDGILQYLFCIESNNGRRIITGLLCGIGISLLIEWFLLFYNKRKENV